VAVFDNFLGQDCLIAARADADSFAARGGLRPAGMGRGGTAWTERRARGDEIAWLHGSQPPTHKQRTSAENSNQDGGEDALKPEHGSAWHAPALQKVVDRMIGLSGDMGTALATLPQVSSGSGASGGGGTEAASAAADLRIDRAALQLAWYRPGGRYVRHSDVGPGQPSR
jgi:hypothetical protein